MATAQPKMTYNQDIRDRHFGDHRVFHLKDKQWTSNSPDNSGG
jgi:hypothetical protein